MSEHARYSDQSEIRSRRETGMLALFSLAVGASIGAALTFLFAPREGNAMHEDLATILDKRLTDVEHKVDDLLFKVEDSFRELP